MSLFGMTLRQALDAYYAFLRAHRSTNTLKMYTGILERLIPALGAKTRIRALTPANLDCALDAILQPHHTPATQESYKRVIRGFFNWLVECRHLKTSPVTFTVHRVTRGPTDTGKAIPDADIEKLLAACQNTRDVALVTFFRDTAFRLGGAWNLRVDGVCPDDRTITSVELKARDGAPHTVYMSDALWGALSAWLGERRQIVASLDHDHGYVFVHLRTGARLTYWGLFQVMRRLGERAGVERFSPHKFRHAWGVWAARNGISVPETQAQMGHKSPSTTLDYYYKAPPESLRRTVNRRANGKGEENDREHVAQAARAL